MTDTRAREVDRGLRRMRQTLLTSPIRQRSAWIPLLLLGAACESDRLKPEPVTDPVETYWALELDHHAVTLSLAAPYDKISLAATPRNFQGAALSGLPAPEFRSADPERVAVSASGAVVALQPTGGGFVVVRATVTAGNLKHQDSVLVRVVDDPDPPVLTTFSIHPIPPDSAKSGAVDFGGVNNHAYNLNTLVRATDADGNPIPDLLVDFRSSDPALAAVNWAGIGLEGMTPQLLGARPGTTTIYASVTAFGVRMADTLPYRIGWPLGGGVYIQPVAEGSPVNTFSNPRVVIGTGGYVLWVNRANVEVDVTFDDATNVAPFNTSTAFSPMVLSALCEEFMTSFGTDCSVGGNFVAPPATPSIPMTYTPRHFPIPGVYGYHSSNGAAGQIVVVDER